MTSSGRGWLGAAIVVALAVPFVVAAQGCELVAAVDRTKIPDAGGGGMGGGAPECNGPADCPVPGNPCMNPTCVAGKCGTQGAAGASCGVGRVCDANGVCAGCGAPVVCPGQDTECQTRTCINSACGISFTMAGTAVAMQTAGDCKVVQCDGAGATKTVDDNNDLPNDGQACTDDLCNAGQPSNPPKAAGVMCGSGSVCDGTGQCVGCVAAADCPGMDTDCQKRDCSATGVCGFTFTAAGTPTQTQTPGDCKEDRCDGTGKVVNANQDTDKPVDANACTDDVCVAGVPGNPPTMAGIACSQNGGVVCNGQSACVQCIMASTCPGQDTECKVRSCTAGACGFSNVAAGTATPTQTPGDCQTSQCDGNGGVTTVANDSDVPDDNNPCTTDSCNAGTVVHTPVAAGTSCGVSLVCDANGACAGCATPSVCPGQDTECQTRTCINTACGFSFTAAGTAVAMQTAGDCKVNQCNGTGAVVPAPDDNDLPVDGNACTNDVCNAGMPSNPPAMSGTVCNQMGGKLCNGAGVCVACLLAPDCPGQDTDCQSRTCMMGACGVANTASGTVTSTQAAGDCLENQCDGMGGVMSVNKDMDLPADANQCTDDLCTAGVPSNPPTMAGAACNQMGGVVCSGMSTCVECVTGAMCPSGVCTGNICQAPNCTDGVKNGTETDVDCGGSCLTKCALGKACIANADCAGDICTTGVCSQINGCDATNTTDLTGMAGTTVLFGGVNGAKYLPKCIKVSLNTNVTFTGNFVNHPLKAGEVVGGVVMPASPGATPLPTDPLGLNVGSTASFGMPTTGVYPYYCTVHVISTGMVGAIFVVP